MVLLFVDIRAVRHWSPSSSETVRGWDGPAETQAWSTPVNHKVLCRRCSRPSLKTAQSAGLQARRGLSTPQYRRDLF